MIRSVVHIYLKLALSSVLPERVIFWQGQVYVSSFRIHLMIIESSVCK